MSSRRGISLIELMVSMAVMLVVLGVAAGLMREYSSAVRFSSAKAASLAAQVALQRMVAETREALVMLAPASSASGSELRFEKIDPSAGEWIPPVVPDPVPVSWDPQPAGLVMEVRYFVDGRGTLVREVTPPAGPLQAWDLAPEISGLAVNHATSGLVELELSVQEPGRLRVFAAKVARPVP